MSLETEITSLVNRLNKYREMYYNEGKSYSTKGPDLRD